MNMNTEDRNDYLDALFARARDLSPAEQRQLAIAECDDEDLRVELLDLLDAHNDAPKPEFENPILPDDAVIDGYEAAGLGVTSSDDGIVRRGQMVGPYKILQELGEGGMGTVYMAEQSEPVARRVALKLIKRGMDSRDVLARFEAERQALSMMDHPNIARVLDAGSDAGRPFFVMELVKGLPITEYCDANRIGTKGRLELFTSVCRGVAHAHQKGIIHRDVKPSNVLVAEYDDDVVPKIIDFGVAKATTQKLTEKTLFTHYGQLVGTVEYMSPEQAKLNQLDIDTRSDVYSLGVLLYELLVGTTPFDRKRLRSEALQEMLRIISEEEPPKLSTRLTSLNSTAEIAAKRNIRPDTLVRILSGELDWIVMRSLEKDRKRRYQSVNEFADDIQRHLVGDAVVACPPTLRYRVGKFVARRKMTVGVVGLVLGLLIVSSIVGWSLYRRADVARKAESVARADAEQEGHRAKAAQAVAEREREIANKQRQIASDRLLVSESARLAAQSQSLMESKPILSALLGMEAVKITHRHGKTVLPIASSALREATNVLGGTPLHGHSERIYAISLSKNGRRFVTAAPDGQILWDFSNPDSPVQLREIPHVGGRTAVFSPNEDWIVTATGDADVRLWDATNLDEAPTSLMNRPNLQTKALRSSANGRWIVMGSYGLLFVWDTTAEHPADSMREFTAETGVYDINKDGRRLVVARKDGPVEVWNINAEQDEGLLHQFDLSDSPTSVSVSPDGRWLVTVGESTLLWDLNASSPEDSVISLRRATGVRVRLGKPVFSRDNRFLAIPGGASVSLYDLKANGPAESCLVLHDPRDGVYKVDISPDLRWIIAAGSRYIRLWDFGSLNQDSLPTIVDSAGSAKLWSADDEVGVKHLLHGQDSNMGVMTVSPDSSRLITGDQSGNLRLWRLDSYNPPASRIANAPEVQTVRISPDGRWLVVGGRGRASRLWELDEQGQLTKSHELRGAADGIGMLVISSDSRWLVATSAVPVYHDMKHHARNERVAHVWDLKSDDPGEKAFELSGHQGGVTAIAINEKNQVVTGSKDRTVRLWDLSTGMATAPLVLEGHDRTILSVDISADGSRIVSGGWKDEAFLWEVKNGSVQKHKLGGHEHAVMKIRISPDGRWIASGGGYDPSFVWDLESSEPMKPRLMPIHQASNSFVTGMAFSRDGKWLATGSWNNKIVMWDLTKRDPFSDPYRVVNSHGFALSFSFDSRSLIAKGQTFGLIIDTTDNKREPIELPPGKYNSVAITPDGRRAVTGGNHQVRLWDLDLESQLEYAKNVVGRDFTHEERTRFSIQDLTMTKEQSE